MMGDWSLPFVAAALVVSLVAGVVRGFSGFGFSAVSVAGLSLFVAPAPIVPALMALEMLASVAQWRGSAGHLDRRWFWWLIGTNLICIPIGVALLVWLPELWLRLAVGLALLVTALALRLGVVGHGLRATTPLHAITGIASGVLNGVAASGGVAAAMLMNASGLAPAALRGTMIVYLVFASAYTFACIGILSSSAVSTTSLLGAGTLRWLLLLLPGLLVGLWLGGRSFANADPVRFRRKVLDLLIVISAAGAARAAYQLAAS